MTIIDSDAVPDDDVVELPTCSYWGCDNTYDPDNRETTVPDCCTHHQEMCDSCLMWNINICHDCGDYHHHECGVNDEHIELCESCYSNSWSYCDRCDSLTRYNTLRHGSCEDCAEEDNEANVNGYCYKPSPRFFGQGPWFGMEIELEYEGGSGSTIRKHAQEAFTDPDVVYLKSDGSIGNGVEIVTHPMSVEWAAENLSRTNLQAIVAEGARSWNTTTCGIHVHAGRSMFPTDSALARFCILIYRSQEAIEKFAGRRGSRWCSFDMSSDESIVKQAAKKEQPYERYRAVNLLNADTVEVRVFRGTLNPDGILGIHQLVAAMAEYSCEKRTGMGLSESLSWLAFRGWLSNNADRFPCAVQRIEARVDRRI